MYEAKKPVLGVLGLTEKKKSYPSLTLSRIIRLIIEITQIDDRPSLCSREIKPFKTLVLHYMNIMIIEKKSFPID